LERLQIRQGRNWFCDVAERDVDEIDGFRVCFGWDDWPALYDPVVEWLVRVSEVLVAALVWAKYGWAAVIVDDWQCKSSCCNSSSSAQLLKIELVMEYQ
jgi:hypothetical protein